MRLSNEFTVAAPIDEVWRALLDPERVAPCMPGATLTGVDGDTFTATVVVKLGPVSLKYQGSGEFLEKDADARRLVIKAAGKDVRGAGTASGTSTVTLSPSSGGTHGDVTSELKVTGRPAQFGRNLIAEVGGRLLGQFAANLADELAPAQQSVPAGDDAPGPVRRPDAVNLLDVAGAPVLKRLAATLAVLAAVLVAIAALRAARRRAK